MFRDSFTSSEHLHDWDSVFPNERIIDAAIVCGKLHVATLGTSYDDVRVAVYDQARTTVVQEEDSHWCLTFECDWCHPRDDDSFYFYGRTWLYYTYEDILDLYRDGYYPEAKRPHPPGRVFKAGRLTVDELN